MNYFRKNSSTIELIKYISIATMIIDHLGFMLMDNNIYMRTIGRFAFVGFAFLVAYNYRYNTKNKLEYKKRLLSWAIISQVPFYFFIHGEVNILFLLLSGLLTIDALKDLNTKTFLPTIYISLSIIISLYSGYSIFGLLTITLFYYAFENKIALLALVINLLFLNFTVIYAIATLEALFIIYYINISFNIKRGPGIIFYIFYPLHITILVLLKLMHEDML